MSPLPADADLDVGPGITAVGEPLGDPVVDGWFKRSFHGYGQLLVFAEGKNATPPGSGASQATGETHSTSTWIRLKRTDATLCVHYVEVFMKPRCRIRCEIPNRGIGEEYIEFTVKRDFLAVNMNVSAQLQANLRQEKGSSSGYLTFGGVTVGLPAGGAMSGKSHSLRVRAMAVQSCSMASVF